MTRRPRCGWLAAAGLAIAALPAAPVAACRCPPVALASAYERADTIFFARVTSRTPLGPDVRLGLAPSGEVYKGRVDPGATFVTAADSAGCGLTAGAGATLLVFAERDGSQPGRWQLHSCNGSREFGTAVPAAAQDFADVPARHVVAQLQSRHAAALLQQVARHAPAEADPQSGQLVGLFRAGALAEIVVLARPEAQAPRLAELRGVQALVTREIAYEEPAAVVYTRLPGWLRVRLAPAARAAGGDGYGWIAEPAAGSGGGALAQAGDPGYTAYERLLPHRLSYLTAHTLRYLWPEPGAGLPQPLRDAGPGQRREWPAVVHEALRVGGLLWLRVEVTDRSPCEGRPPRVVAAGWVPGYGSNGEPAAWFHSRGC